VLLTFQPTGQPPWREEPVAETKPFSISKRAVWKAWLCVKANQGAAGVDGASIAQFETRLKKNLYKIWNRGGSPVICGSRSSRVS
jgi:retron-type reverse transcriptase